MRPEERIELRYRRCHEIGLVVETYMGGAFDQEQLGPAAKNYGRI